jgi:hypothetical protein
MPLRSGFASQQPFERPPKLSTNSQQSFCANYLLSALYVGQISLADTYPVGELALRCVKSSEFANSATDCFPVYQVFAGTRDFA